MGYIQGLTGDVTFSGGAGQDPITILNYGVTHSAKIVARRSPLGLAPEAINFEVVVDGFDTPGPAGGDDVYDPQFHGLYFLWDHGDPGSTFTAPQKLPGVHLDANRGYGPLSSHTYQAPGTYTPTCLVLETSSGKAALATVIEDTDGTVLSGGITVGNADTFFAGNKTYFISTDATFARAPVGAQTFADAATAIAAQMSAQSADGTLRIRQMFDREVEHDWISASGHSLRNNLKNLWLCHSPGSGTPGVIRVATNETNGNLLDDQMNRNEINKVTQVTIDGLNIDGQFDVTTETPGGSYNRACTFLAVRTSFGSDYYLYNKVTAKGFSTTFASLDDNQKGPDTVDLIFNDCAISDWQNFGVYEEEQGFTAYTGTRIVQNPLALSGGVKGMGHNEHGPVRIQKAAKCVMHACDVYSKNGWFENALGIHTPQPGIRFNQQGDIRAKLNMQACAVESAYRAVESGRDGTTVPGVTQCNILIDKCALVGGCFADCVLITQHSGMTLRNSLLVLAGDRTALGAFNQNAFIDLNARWDNAIYLATPNKLYNNTFLNQIIAAQSVNNGGAAPIFRLSNNGGGDFSDVVEQNNVLHQPNISTPDIDQGPLGTTPLLTTRHDDYRSYNQLSDAITLTGDVVDGGALFIPYTDFPGTWVQADFDPTPTIPRRDHQFIVGNSFAAATYSFGATGVTVTNDSGSTWAIGSAVRMNAGTVAVNIQTEHATPDDAVWNAVPGTGSTAEDAATTGLRAWDDHFGNLLISETAPAEVTRNAGAFD